MYIVEIFIFIYIFAIIVEQSKYEAKKVILIVGCIILTFFAGTRDIYFWPDTFVYYKDFVEYNTDIFNFTSSAAPFGYSEKGFQFLGSIVKTFTSNATIYFSFVAGLSFFFLYKFLRQYCIYPVLGLAVYISRFLLGRNFVQIRSGLAYLIILLGIKYVTERDWKRYFLIVFIAFLFHRSALIAIPLYFMGMINVKKWHVVAGTALSFIISGFFNDELQLLISDNAHDLNIYSYTVGLEVEKAKGLANPVIYFQTIILLFYTFAEDRLIPTTKHYYTFRNAYLFSTMILIAFCHYVGLSGRTSTLFATLEVVLIPSSIFLFQKKNRIVAYIGIGIILGYFFFAKYNNALA